MTKQGTFLAHRSMRFIEDANIKYAAYVYEGVNHGFHNDTTPRYDKNAAQLAWKRTLEFFRAEL